MPLAGRDVDQRAAGVHVDGVGEMAGIVIEVLLEMPTEADDCLGGGPVPMNGQDRAGLDGVEHPLGLVRRGVPEIEVHPEPGRGLRLGGEVIQYVLVDSHTPLAISRVLMISILFNSSAHSTLSTPNNLYTLYDR